MEAATPLRGPRVAVVGERLVVQELDVQDPCAARLVRERSQAGEDPAKTVCDAITIGARVLDREQAAANAEYVKTEFERASKELEQQFGERAQEVAERFGAKVDEVFGPEHGQLAKDLEKLFGDASAGSVQNRVRELVAETLTRSREDLVRQFSAADGSNPLADFKAGALESINQAAVRSHQTQRALLEKLAELRQELQALRDEKRRVEDVEAERERGTAKGRSFEEGIAAAVDALALAQGDVAEAVGDRPGSEGKTGDVLVAVAAATGPARGRIVFEAKDRRLSQPRALQELDRAIAHRDADYAVLVVPSDEELPAKLEPLREYNGDKLVVALEVQDPPGLALEIAYRLARARVLMSRGGEDGVDGTAVHDLVERAVHAMSDVRKVKGQLTGAKTNIDNAYALVEEMAARVRARLAELDELVLGGADARAPVNAGASVGDAPEETADDQLAL